MTRMERPTATMARLEPRRRAIRRYLLAEEGVGLGGARGGVAQHGGQVGVAVAGGALAFLLPRGFLDARGQPGPGGQVPGGGEAGHVGADLGEDHIRAGQADAGDLIQAGHRVGERGGLRRRSGRPGRRCRR